jgi:mannosyltransferase
MVCSGPYPGYGSPPVSATLGTMPAMDAAPPDSSSTASLASVVETETVTAVPESERDPTTARPGRGSAPGDPAAGSGDGNPGHVGNPGRGESGEGPSGGSGTRPGPGEGSGDPEGPPFSHVATGVIAVAVAAVLAVAVALRFWTTSDLWLDEALTVNIAHLPLHEIPSYLKRDGSPPLYYYLLHFWMSLFGTSDVAVRSLSGVFGVITLPLVWLAGRRLGGKTLAWAALLLLASSPFAVRYDTETRMYALVTLLTVLGFLALDRSLSKPRPGNLVAVGVITALLLYTHYWALYLVGTVVLWLGWEAWRGRTLWRTGARRSLVAVLVGCLAFIPWLPIFWFQTRHTGTPWATTASFASMVSAISAFAGGGSNSGKALGLMIFALAGLGVFGLAAGRRHINLDLRTQPASRPLAWVVIGTLGAALAGGLVAKSTFDPRYASVVFIPLILLVAVGVSTFVDRRIRLGVLALAVAVGLAGAIPDVTTNRTQAGQVAQAIATYAKPGDIVAYCPDQLGPAVNRLLPAGRYVQTTFPRRTGPDFVNWVDYGAAVKRASALAFAEHLESLSAASGRQIFVVWGGGYQGFGLKCEGIVQTLQGNPHYHVQQVIRGNAVSFYQPMWMVRFTPITS